MAQILRDRKGVCQDFAHLAIGCLRSLGLAARYVPQAGWVNLDPTNNLVPGDRHITLAWGRDYGDVTPVKGVVMGGGRHALSVTVDVTAQNGPHWKPWPAAG